MDPLTIGALGIGALKSGLDLFSGFSKGDYQRQVTAENLRRLQLKADATTSEAKALGGEASGITSDSSSLTTYIDSMQKEFKRQAAWMQTAGEQGAKASEMSGIFGAIGDMGGSLFQFGQSNNWFKTPTVKP